MVKKVIRKVLSYFFPSIIFSISSYSQHGEDMLLKSFSVGEKGYKGFYVDIGAHHPFRFSNTVYFYKRGWSGINIEPTPSLISAFNRFRKRDINLNIGVSNSNSIMTFYEFNEPALNSFDEKLSVSRENEKYRIIGRKNIPVFTLSYILTKYLPKEQKIDLLNIDAEGLDLIILKSNDWSKFIPKFILIEGTFKDDELNDDEVYNFLKSRNYDMVGRTKRTYLFENKSD